MTTTGGGGPRPRGRGWREAAVTATAFALCLLGGVVRVDDTLSAPPAAAYVIAVVSCAVLPLRHRAPLAVLAATTAVGLLVPLLGLLLTPLIAAPAVITAYSCALAARTERSAASAVSLASAALVASIPLSGDFSWKDASRMGVVAAFPLVAGVLGRSVRNRRAYLAAVEERARRAEESRDHEARRRVAEERVRIARELHDLVAHQITLANAQATVAAHLFDTRPEQTRKSLGELVETTGHALDELRATVGLLRQSGDASGDASGPAEPAPGLSRLPALLESFRRAGLEVTIHQEGTATPLPPGVDLTAYRIVQEALTNVTKHAGTGGARVRLGWNRDRVTITVADDGGGARTAPAGSRGPAASTEPGPAGSRGPRASTGPDRPPGYGLIGMRERATAVGGHLSAGRRPEGGFLVSAQLPLPSVRDTTRRTDGAATTEEERMADGTVGDGGTDDARTGGGEAGDAP
ncbi:MULTISPECIES: sensor histidine kinase [Streptomyces]|uniref:histidine kinase n=2 Tax=Streptomyces TaxID=1883 RepID=A0A3R7HB30_9ACTN|nr:MULTISPECIES: histidine kinase [Streptomyces]KNE82657.1 histidine kinase [Streptomyces fradiae]OFA52361.1 two-component sensor histidine kinase [Streptomyces fradiae]PQM21030.1 two-component sensor histidine kinase [Streptomyces xinghaiensis]RKM92884.1 two-component sensor histidine kinase [Streptomyces xinghaiensis]RNC72472.1 two-component sensor histidine kinase [Streptomyces xinghaiensis]